MPEDVSSLPYSVSTQYSGHDRDSNVEQSGFVKPFKCLPLRSQPQIWILLNAQFSTIKSVNDVPKIPQVKNV